MKTPASAKGLSQLHKGVALLIWITFWLGYQSATCPQTVYISLLLSMVFLLFYL